MIGKLKFLKEVFEFKYLSPENFPEFVFWGRSNVGNPLYCLTKSKLAKTSKTPDAQDH